MSTTGFVILIAAATVAPQALEKQRQLIVQINAQIDENDRKTQDLSQQSADLQSQLRNQRAALQDLQAQQLIESQQSYQIPPPNVSLELQINELQREIETARADLQRMDAEIRRYEQSYMASTQLDDLYAQRPALVAELSRLQRQYQNAKTQQALDATNAQSSRNSIEAAQRQLQGQVQQAQQSVNALEKQLTETQTEYSKTLQARDALDTQYEDARRVYEEMQPAQTRKPASNR